MSGDDVSAGATARADGMSGERTTNDEAGSLVAPTGAATNVEWAELSGREPSPCPSCGRFWFHKEGCTDEH